MAVISGARPGKHDLPMDSALRGHDGENPCASPREPLRQTVSATYSFGRLSGTRSVANRRLVIAINLASSPTTLRNSMRSPT